MSTIAAFIAMGGVSYAAIVITGANVKNGTLTGADLKDSSVAAVDVANGSLGLNELTPAAQSSVTMDAEDVGWDRLTAVPGGFADGVDNDTDTDTDTDTNTTYTAGTGLALSGTTFSADGTWVQRRVAGGCAAGESIRVIAADGAVTCETDTDTDTDTNTTYGAGSGLKLTGTTFAVDADVIQGRVASGCPAGQSIRAIAADGAVTCEDDTDTDTNTTYGAGDGLSLDGTTFKADASYVQRRVSSSCTAGESIRAIAADGTVTCEADDIASVTAGLGIVLDEDTVLVDGDVVTLDSDTINWARLASVPGGFADGFDNDTLYGAGTGLTLTGTTFAVNPSLVQSRVTGTCTTGQFMQLVASNGSVTCSGYTPGNGVAISGSSLSVDTTYAQRRVSSACTAGQSIRAIAGDGSVTCEVDDDSDTTYGAGAGLTLSGTTFSPDTTFLQRRVASGCPAGQSIRSIAADGAVTCEVDDSTSSPYSAGTGLSLIGSTFTANTTYLQRRIAAGCEIGDYMRGVAADGSVTCATDTDTNSTYGAGTGLSLSGSTFNADTSVLQRRASGTCASGIASIGATGAVTCTTPVFGSEGRTDGAAFTTATGGAQTAATVTVIMPTDGVLELQGQLSFSMNAANPSSVAQLSCAITGAGEIVPQFESFDPSSSTGLRYRNVGCGGQQYFGAGEHTFQLRATAPTNVGVGWDIGSLTVRQVS